MPLFEFDEKFLLFDATPVENIFLQEYMPAAKGEYVKVYLYGLMHSYHKIEGMTLDTMSKDLAMSQEEIQGAFRYWERKGLVQRISEKPLTYRYVNAKQLMFMKQTTPKDQAYEHFAEAVYSAFGNERQIHGSEMALAYEWVEDLQLPIEVVLYFIQYCIVNRGVHFTFKAAEKLAVSLAEKKVTTVEEAEEILSMSTKVEEGTKKILRRLGKRRQPSKDEMDLYRKWINDWGYKHEAIEAACVETTKGDPNMGYLDGILKGLMEQTGKGFSGKKEVEAHLNKQKNQGKPVRELLNALGMRYIRGNQMIQGLYEQMLSLSTHEVLMVGAREVAKTGGKMDELVSLITTWTEKGINTEEKALAYVAAFYQANQLLVTIYEIAGHNGRPTANHRQLVKKWQEEWGFSEEMLGIAAQNAQHAEKKIPYIDAILSAWHEQGIDTVDKVESVQTAHQQKSVNNIKSKGKKKVSEQQYEQRNYEEIDLMKQAA
ncbi:MAG: DnaD domain protein, partial [Clostridiales bacterium]|nr:DnaD domain protein [Clostridiales bacterium]